MLLRITVVQLLLGAVASALAADITIRGRLVDAADGAPLADVRVKALAPAMGEDLWEVQNKMFRSITDAQGRFAIQVPGELLFSVFAEGSGGYADRSVISGETGEIELRMKRELPADRLAGRILDQAGMPAAELEVALVGEYGVRRTTRTDRNGSFQFTSLPAFGQGVLLASNQSTVLPQRIVSARSPQPIELTLAQGATLSGNLIENISRSPAAGIKVSVRPDFMSGYQLSTTSDANGNWMLKDIPAGEYVVETSGAEHFDPVSDGSFDSVSGGRRLELGKGGTNSLNIALSRKATLTGEVRANDGRPIAGALVAVPDSPEGAMLQQTKWVWVRTTEDGRFVIRTGRLNGMQVTVFDAIWGLQLVWVKPLAAGETRQIIVPPMRGSVRVKGMITDEAGKGIDRIGLVPAWFSQVTSIAITDGGRFDLGRLPLLEATEKFALHLRAPRPGGTTMSLSATDPIWRTIPQVVEGRSFYIDSEISLQSEHNQILDLKPVMKPAQLVVLRGRITEENGQAPGNGQVFVFRGTENGDWARRVLPNFQGGGTIGYLKDSRPLGGTECGTDGTFTIYVLQNDGEAAISGVRFSLGFAADGQPRHLLTQVIVPRDAKALSLDLIKLPAPTAPGKPVAASPIRDL
jgi:hypothetical protein